MKKILILGANGNLGKILIPFFKNKKFEVHHDENIDKEKRDSYENFILKKIDKIEIILNLVGYYGKSRSKLENSNIEFVKTIVNQLNSNKNKKILFIHLSTIGVLDLNSHNKEIFKANNYYEYTKILSEKIITNEKNNFSYLIIRPAAFLDIDKSKFLQNLSQAIFFRRYLFVFSDRTKVYYTNINELVEFLFYMINQNTFNKSVNFVRTEDVSIFYKTYFDIKLRIFVFSIIFKLIIKFLSKINNKFNFIFDNKFLKYFWMFNSEKII